MTLLRFLGLFLSTLATAAMLLGCPQGAGPNELWGSDADAGDADANSAESDAGDDSGDGDAEPPSGARCGVNDLDQCAPLRCDTAFGCVECSGASDCAASVPACLEGQCVGCRPGSPSDCAVGTACSVEDYECHPRCANDDACGAGLHCDVASGECVGCSADTDCQSGVCSASTRRCVECASNDACPQKRPRCRVALGSCVACLSNEDCGITAPVCDPLTFTCRVGCWSDAQCPGQACDLATARCVDAPPAAADGG